MTEREKLPPCRLTGTEANVFNIIATVARCLVDAGLGDRAGAWRADAMASRTYDEVLRKLHRYVDPT